MKPPSSAHDALRAAFAACLAGDTRTQHAMLDRGRALLAAEDHAARVQRALSVDFYVNARGVAYPSRVLAKAAGDLQ